MTNVREIRHFHMACGLGGGAKGFNKATPRAGGLVGRMRCIGSVDADAAALVHARPWAACAAQRSVAAWRLAPPRPDGGGSSPAGEVAGQ